TVVLVEGEKARDALAAREILTVATVTGAAGTPSDEMLRVLAGRQVVLWPDADRPGRTHMHRIGERLTALGITHRLVDPWPHATHSRDAADFAGTDEELRTVLAAGAVPWMPLASVQPEAVSWLWEGRIALGKVTLLEGDPDEGKSCVALDLA